MYTISPPTVSCHYNQLFEMLSITCLSPNHTHISNPDHWNSILKHQVKLKNDAAILATFSHMEALSISPNSTTLPLILKACSKIRAIETGKRVHSNIQGHELVKDVRVRSALVDFYGKCGLLDDARKVFDQMPERDVVLWNAMINSYVGCCCYEEALLLFRRIWAEKLSPSSVTLVTLLVACGELLRLRLGQEIHGFFLRNGFLDSESYIATALIGFYSKFDVRASRVLFDSMGVRNVVNWNAIIGGYHGIGDLIEALKLFVKMLGEGVKCDNVTILVALQACSDLGCLELGMQLHQLATKFGYVRDLHITNALLNLYRKTFHLEYSYRLFESTPMHDIATWNSMISAFAECEMYEEAWRVFSRMQSDGVQVSEATMTILLSICSETCNDSKIGKSLHAKVMRSGFHGNTSVANGVLRMYAELNYITDAIMVFNELITPDVISWNVIISALAGYGLRNRAWNYFEQMLDSEIKPNSHTIISILAVCKDEVYVNVGRSLHGCLIKHGIEVNKELNTALVEMYINCGDEAAARNLFERCSKRDVVSWNSLIASYVRNNLASEALPLLKQMIYEVEPNSVTLINILSSCTDMASLPLGQCLHGYTIHKEYFGGLNLSLGNALLSMYARCGCMHNAEKIFKTMQKRNISSWNALVAGYGLNGQVNDAIHALSQMLKDGFKPNGRTLLSVLSACNHSGMVEKGLELFKSMTRDCDINPMLVHYGCLVDLLGRAGYIDEAKIIIDTMPFEPDASVLRALLCACRDHSELGLAKHIFQRLVEIEPLNPGNYVLLSNIYAAKGLWSEVTDLRMHMKEKGMKKNPGISWIYVRNQAHCFIAGDRSCVKAGEIYGALDSLLSTMKDDGYSPDFRWVTLEEGGERGTSIGIGYI